MQEDIRLLNIARHTPGTRINKPATAECNPAQHGVEKIESHLRDEVQWQTHPDSEGLYLRKNAESLFVPADGQARGTVVLYHGFTAAPWQYKEMADKLHHEGFNVYAPRMPGHGLADAAGKPSAAEMPETNEQKIWDDFARQTTKDAAELGVPVHAVGLSGGANVALRAAEECPEVESVTTMAPFLGSGASGIFFPVLNVIDMVTFGLFGNLLDKLPRKEKPQVEEMPKTEGTWGNALAMYRVGARVKKVDVPLQAITTEGDPLSGAKQVHKLLKHSRNGQNIGWYHFGPEDHVKHAMVSPQENANSDSVALIQNIVTRFAESGETTSNRSI